MRFVLFVIDGFLEIEMLFGYGWCIVVICRVD